MGLPHSDTESNISDAATDCRPPFPKKLCMEQESKVSVVSKDMLIWPREEVL